EGKKISDVTISLKRTDERQSQQCICGTSDPDAFNNHDRRTSKFCPLNIKQHEEFYRECGTSPADSDHILHQIYTNKALAQARNAAKWSRNILHPIYDSRDYSEFAKKFVEYLEDWEAKRKRREAEKKKIKREKSKAKKARAVDADEEREEEEISMFHNQDRLKVMFQ
ncbi:hypothetical protein HDV05_006346, partial [Chytridiales sp. JEL 0842]